MLSCKEVTRLLSEAEERPLGVRERVALRLHLLICDGCTNFRRQIIFLRRSARRYFGHDEGGTP